MSEKMHWLATEVPLHEDVNDWNNKLSGSEKNFLSFVFRLFTQGDLDVADGYIKEYLPVFHHPEIRMMLLSFAGREATHIRAYSHLTETLGMADSFYSEFLDFPVMKEKHEYFEQMLSVKKNKANLPMKIAGISAFVEGMFLFSSFVMLLTFPRSGRMKGMGQIVTWSVLDESIHVEGLVYLFRTILNEHPEWWNNESKQEIYATAEKMLKLEDDFIDLVYGDEQEIRGLDKDQLKRYIRYIIDRRLISMGMRGINGVKKNPLPWVDEMINSQNHENFFENRATSYAKGAVTGSWGDVWGTYS
jgi:ribonucleoside-diphosphate reductase beta chain